MNPRTIARIARWAAAAAVLTIAAVGGLLAYRAYRASRAVRRAPAAVPASVQQRSLQFTFSKVEGNQTIFTIRAARLTEFHGDHPNELQDVDIVVYGEHGNRHDEIHTRACDYAPDTGAILCRGKVELDLANAPGKAGREHSPLAVAAPGAPAGSQIRIVTSHVGFRRDSGEAQTSNPLTFTFPAGQGSATGAEYSSRKSNLVLDRDVQLTLKSRQPGSAPARITAPGGMSYDRTSGQLVLRGPVKIVNGGRSIETPMLVVKLSRELVPVRAIARGKTMVAFSQGAKHLNFRSGGATIDFDARGRATRFVAGGHVVARENPPRPITFRADRVSIAMDPDSQQPRSVDASGNVRLYASSAGKTESLETQSLHLTTVPAPGAEKALGGWARRKPGAAKAPSLQLERAEADAPARVEWESRGERLDLNAGRLAAVFGAGNKVKRLSGGGGIRLAREIKGSAPIVTTATALDVRFADGQWTRATESGKVTAVQGDRRASAETGEWTRATGALDLSGGARISDAESQTLANEISWNQETGELHAAGNVRTSYFSANSARVAGPAQAMPSAGPANVVAEALQANAKTGAVTFTGNARLWQGDLVIQAPRIELRRDSGELLAEGGVRAAFPQTQAVEAAGGKHSAAKKPRQTGSGPVLWRVTANRLRYTNRSGAAPKRGEGSAANEGGEAVFDGGVRAWSKSGEIDAAKLVLQLERDSGGRAELAQADASGCVHMRQGKRWGQAQNGQYFAKEGKFVLSGGHPSLHDASGDLVTGSQLTFYVADDTILVESAKGSRTLTRHSVPK